MAANDEIFDAFVRQQVNLQRMSKTEAARLTNELRKADTQLNALIKQRLAKTKGIPDYTTKRYMAMVKEIRELRTSAIQSFGTDLESLMDQTMRYTFRDSFEALQRAVPVELNWAMPNVGAVREAVMAKPFGTGENIRTVAEWVSNLADADMARINGAVRAGIANGETIPQIMQRVDQVTDMARANVEAITRTAVNSASNSAREAFFDENKNVIAGLRWVATLDGRTSAVCRARDGHFDAVTVGGDLENVPEPHIEGSPRRPPAHMRCRSLMIAVLDPDGVEAAMPERPYVRDKRTRKQREKDFRKDAKERVGKERWSEMSRQERDAEIRRVRQEWTKENIGTVPGDTSYDTWLRNQTPEFQDQVLGPTRAEGFRNGLSMEQYVDEFGDKLTIKELQDQYPAEMGTTLPEPGDMVLRPAEVEVDAQTMEQTLEVRKNRDANPNAVNNQNTRHVNELRDQTLKEVADEYGLESVYDLNPETRAEFKRRYKERLYSTIPPGEDPVAYRKFLDSLAGDDFDLLDEWGSGVAKIRAAQRGNFRGTPTERAYFEEQGRRLEDLVTRGPDFEGQHLFRGLGMSKAEFEALEIGSDFFEGAISSYSYDPWVSAEFATMGSIGRGKVPVLIRTESLPSGMTLNIQNLTDNTGHLAYEAEVLMSRNAQFVVTSIEKVKFEDEFMWEVTVRAAQ